MPPQEMCPVVACTILPAGVLALALVHELLYDLQKLPQQAVRFGGLPVVTFHEGRHLDQVYMETVLLIVLRFLVFLVRFDVSVQSYIVTLCRWVCGVDVLQCVRMIVHVFAGGEEVYFRVE